MAKIVVNVDTENDSLDVSVNGQIQDNVKEVSFCRFKTEDGEMQLCSNITLMDENAETGITKVTYLMAKDSIEAKNLRIDKFKQDILNYFSRS